MHKNLSKSFKVIISFKLVKWILIPFLLLFLWFFPSLINGSYESPSVLEYLHSQEIAKNPIDGKILKNEKISGKFLAKKNNLGIVTVKIEDVTRVDYKQEDILIFRIKEEGMDEWLYTNKYRSGQMKPDSYFPFGFGIIEDSKDKSYVFEISSLNGDPSNAIQIHGSNLKFTTKYKFSKGEILKEKNEFVDFTISKIIAIFTNKDYLLDSSFFLLPFIFYIVYIIFVQENTLSSFIKKNKLVSGVIKRLKEQFLSKKKYSYALLCLTLILVYLFAIDIITTGLTLGLLGLWIIAVYINKFSSKITYLLALVIICISVIATYFNWSLFVDDVSAFGYMILLIGLFQDLLEFKKNKRKK